MQIDTEELPATAGMTPRMDGSHGLSPDLNIMIGLPGFSTKVPGMMARLAAIRILQQRAIYPLDTVGAVRASSQLAHVEVSWLAESLSDALQRIQELEADFR